MFCYEQSWLILEFMIYPFSYASHLSNHRQLCFWYPLQSTTTILSNLKHPRQHPLQESPVLFMTS
jgi:hypothetical protein